MTERQAAETTAAHEPHRAFAELSRIMLGSQPLAQVLERIAALAKETIPGADEVSVTLLEGQRAHSAAFTGPLAVALDERQYAEGFGPCMDAAASGATIVVAFGPQEDRYPDFGLEARRRGVRCVLAVGLPIPQRIIGALNVYGGGDAPFDDDAVQVAQTFAGYAAVALANAALYNTTAELAQHLQQAMQSRGVIEQAKGILMGRHHCTADEAFAMLAQASQRSNRKLRDLAQAMVDGVEVGLPRPGARSG
jgi:GAF domain-containing protein